MFVRACYDLLVEKHRWGLRSCIAVHECDVVRRVDFLILLYDLVVLVLTVAIWQVLGTCHEHQVFDPVTMQRLEVNVC